MKELRGPREILKALEAQYGPNWTNADAKREIAKDDPQPGDCLNRACTSPNCAEHGSEQPWNAADYEQYEPENSNA